MKSDVSINHFVRFLDDGRPRWGVQHEDHVLALDGSPLQGGRPTSETVGRYEDLTLLPPVTPSKIICVGRNYEAHAAEHGVVVPTEPLLFLKPPSSLIADGEAIVLPSQSEQVEHESELGVVVGQRCRNVTEAEAWEKVLGVVCANDVTARDLQRKDKQWTRGKGFDSFCPAGPALVTGLIEEDINRLQVLCRVNTEVRQRGNTSQMVFTPSFLIAYISAIMTLEPGDLILTGTPAGVGPLSSGDIVEVHIENVGRLQNPVRSSG